MSKKDERNLNIILKNEGEDNEVALSIITLLKKLKKYLLLWIIAAVVLLGAAFGYATITTHVKKAPLEALVNFSYDGIEKGLDPSGRKFDVNTIKSPSVIEEALTELQIDLDELEYIRQGISFEGRKPDDIIDRINTYQSVLEQGGNGSITAVEKILETTYYPTQFVVSFDYNNTGLTDSQAVDVFNMILDKYKDYFYKRYGYNESLGNAVTAVNYVDYDYNEAVDVFSESLSSLKSYVKQLSRDDETRFRSAETGYTFSDLYEAIDTVQSIDLDKISSYVTVNNLTKDKDDALAYCEYRIKALGRLKAQYEEQLEAINESIDNYQKDEIIVFGGAEDTSTQSKLASAQYDKMFGQKNDIAEDLATTRQRINYYKERQEALKGKAVGSKDKVEKLEGNLEALNNKINDLVELVYETSEDYYRNVSFSNAYNILVPASNSTSNRIGRIINNAKLPLIVLEMLGFAVYFAFAFCEAMYTDYKKRRALATGKSDDEENNEEKESGKKDDEKSEK